MRLGAPASGAIVLTAALMLSGCAAQNEPSPYATTAAANLQQTVLHVTEAARDGEYPAARTRLDELEVATKVAHARGELSQARHDSILAAIALVRADLEQLIAVAEAAAGKKKAEEEAREAEEEAAAQEAQKAAEAQAAAERQAEEEAAPSEADEVSGDSGGKGEKGNKGNGNGNGKNKGNGKGKGRG
jgi:membrane protein involved in colicin uptake